MVIDMNKAQVRTLEQAREVLAGTQRLDMRPIADQAGRYALIETALKRFDRCAGSNSGRPRDAHCASTSAEDPFQIQYRPAIACHI